MRVDSPLKQVQARKESSRRCSLKETFGFSAGASAVRPEGDQMETGGRPEEPRELRARETSFRLSPTRLDEKEINKVTSFHLTQQYDQYLTPTLERTKKISTAADAIAGAADSCCRPGKPSAARSREGFIPSCFVPTL